MAPSLTAEPGELPDPIDPADAVGAARWCEVLGITTAQLAEAVLAVGGDAMAVREHLLNQGASAGAS